MRILCVDDEALVRMVTSDLLRELGHEVLEAPGPEEGLASIRAADEPFDLLLTDIMMPGPIDGRGFAKLAIEAQPGLPVIYFSGYSRIVTADDTGARVLPKPCSIGTLQAAIAGIA
jgi:CheY-like chemotaxis protein